MTRIRRHVHLNEGVEEPTTSGSAQNDDQDDEQTAVSIFFLAGVRPYPYHNEISTCRMMLSMSWLPRGWRQNTAACSDITEAINSSIAPRI